MSSPLKAEWPGVGKVKAKTRVLPPSCNQVSEADTRGW